MPKYLDRLLSKYQNEIDRLKSLHEQYESYLPAIFFALGFVIDIITLGEVDDLSNILMISFYLIACLMILALEYIDIDETKLKNKWIKRGFDYREDIFHLFLGALLSVFTLFYFKSGSLSNSFVFLFIMISLLLLNEAEFFKKIGIIIRTSLVMLCLISYLIYIVPIMMGATSTSIFFICVFIAICISLTSFYFLTKFNQDQKRNLKNFLIPQLAVALIFMSLYGCKVIPPIPLSLKYIGIFHDVNKSESGYETSELKSWWNFWDNGDESFEARDGDKVYLFTKIFSPGGFSGKVYIHWLYDNGEGYQTSDKIPLNITGGRSEGFRGYAYKSNYTPGDWQVRVETDEGLEIGRIYFEIEEDHSKNEREYVKIMR